MKDEGGSMVQVKVEAILFDLTTNMPVVVLKDMEGKRVLPIWIGSSEAQAIEMELERIKPPRPMTHDLLRNIVEALRAKVEKVCVIDLQDNTFIATVVLVLDGGHYEVDSRPSDAIALALRADAPIYANEALLKDSSILEGGESKTEDEQEKHEKERFRKFLENIKPDDFKYRH